MRAWPAVVDRAGAALDRLAELAREGVDVLGVLEREDEVDGLETTVLRSKPDPSIVLADDEPTNNPTNEEDP